MIRLILLLALVGGSCAGVWRGKRQFQQFRPEQVQQFTSAFTQGSPGSQESEDQQSSHQQSHQQSQFGSFIPSQLPSGSNFIGTSNFNQGLNQFAQGGKPQMTQSDEFQQYKVIPIISYDHEPSSGEGKYKFSYESGDGTKREESGSQRAVGEPPEIGTVSRGSYSYIDPDGNLVSLSFTADERGFLPVGSHIPSNSRARDNASFRSFSNKRRSS